MWALCELLRGNVGLYILGEWISLALPFCSHTSSMYASSSLKWTKAKYCTPIHNRYYWAEVQYYPHTFYTHIQVSHSMVEKRNELLQNHVIPRITHSQQSPTHTRKEISQHIAIVKFNRSNFPECGEEQKNNIFTCTHAHHEDILAFLTSHDRIIWLMVGL